MLRPFKLIFFSEVYQFNFAFSPFRAVSSSSSPAYDSFEPTYYSFELAYYCLISLKFWFNFIVLSKNLIFFDFPSFGNLAFFDSFQSLYLFAKEVYPFHQ